MQFLLGIKKSLYCFLFWEQTVVMATLFSNTCIVVKHCGHVLWWELIRGVANQHTRFADGPVPYHHTLDIVRVWRVNTVTPIHTERRTNKQILSLTHCHLEDLHDCMIECWIFNDVSSFHRPFQLKEAFA